MENMMSPYEQVKIAEMAGRKANGATITAIVLAGGALVAGVGAWIFSGVYTSARAKGNERALDQLSTLLLAEHNERVNQAPRLVDYVNVQTGAYAGAGANSAANAFSQAEAQIVANALTGRSQLCPQPVSIYSAPQPCGCPGTCG